MLSREPHPTDDREQLRVQAFQLLYELAVQDPDFRLEMIRRGAVLRLVEYFGSTPINVTGRAGACMLLAVLASVCDEAINASLDIGAFLVISHRERALA